MFLLICIVLKSQIQCNLTDVLILFKSNFIAILVPFSPDPLPLTLSDNCCLLLCNFSEKAFRILMMYYRPNCVPGSAAAALRAPRMACGRVSVTTPGGVAASAATLCRRRPVVGPASARPPDGGRQGGGSQVPGMRALPPSQARVASEGLGDADAVPCMGSGVERSARGEMHTLR